MQLGDLVLHGHGCRVIAVDIIAHVEIIEKRLILSPGPDLEMRGRRCVDAAGMNAVGRGRWSEPGRMQFFKVIAMVLSDMTQVVEAYVGRMIEDYGYVT